jgi:hypothetical protein
LFVYKSEKLLDFLLSKKLFLFVVVIFGVKEAFEKLDMVSEDDIHVSFRYLRFHHIVS